MTFPLTVLPITVELNLDSVWTDITTDVRSEQTIRITRGKTAEGAATDPGSCSLTLANLDGKYSPRNPLSPYYGVLGRNTPIRVSAAGGEVYLNLPGGSGDRIATPDDASLDITGDIDVQVEASFDNWEVTSTTELIAKYLVTGNQRSWRLMLGTGGTMVFSWSNDGTAFTDVQSTDTVQGSADDGRLAIRVTFDVDNGASGNTTTFYYARTINGPWTQLGDAVVNGGTTSIFSSTATLQIGDISALSFTSPTCHVHKAKVLNGIAGSAVANPDFTAQTVGASSFADAAGRTWTVAGSATLSNLSVRFVGNVSNWPSAWEAGGFDVTTSIEAAGILRQLGQGTNALDSTMTRTIPSDTSVIAYWPMEDGSGATSAGSPLDGVTAMATSGFTFAAGAPTASGLPTGSASLPTLATGATFSGTVPTVSASTHWQVEFFFKVPTAPTTSRTIMTVRSSGTVAAWYVQMRNDVVTMLGNSAEGDVLISSTLGSGGSFFGGWRRMRLRATQSGGNIAWTTQWFTLGGEGLDSDSGTVTGTVGHVTRVTGDPAGLNVDLNGMGLGHIAVFNSALDTIFTGADVGFNGETAGNRLIRLSSETGIPIIVSGLPNDTITVGPQPQDTFLNVVNQCSDADAGILYERRNILAVGYRDRSTLYDQRITLTMDYSNSEVQAPFLPVDDDQTLRNDVTVTRSNGIVARQFLSTGPLSIQNPPDGVGSYTTSVTLNLHADERALELANWFLHLGTWDEARFPSVYVNLAHNPELSPEATRVEVGDRIQVTNPPAWLPPGTIDLMVLGYTETLAQFQWDIVYVCQPYGPWNASTVEDTTYGWVDTDGSTLDADATSGATTIDVDTQTDSAVWVDSATYASDFPFDILVGGERMTVTATTGTSNPQTDTVTRSVNGIVKAQTTGTAVSLFNPAYVVL